MIRWRGQIRKLEWVLVRHRLRGMKLHVSFLAYDDANPEEALARESFVYEYPLAAFKNKTLAQVRQLVLDMGIVAEVEPLPPGAPTPRGMDLNLPPDPPPLRGAAATWFQEYQDNDAVQTLPPEVFGP